MRILQVNRQRNLLIVSLISRLSIKRKIEQMGDFIFGMGFVPGKPCTFGHGELTKGNLILA
jgi:hypothetical protein